MELVEFYRVRRILIWYAAIVAAIVLLVLLFSNNPNIVIDVGEHADYGAQLTTLLGIAMFFTAAVASWIGLSLNAENATREFAWTRPIARTALAARYIAIDLAALAVAYAFTVLGAWTIVAVAAHGAVAIDPAAPVALLLSAGVVAMWYALLQLVSAPFRGRGGSIAGVLWAASLVLISVAQVTPRGFLHAIALVLNVINPFAYLSTMVHTDSAGAAGPLPSVWALDPMLRAGIVWLFAGLFCAAAVAIWTRREI
jgi:hypothetical protein